MVGEGAPGEIGSGEMRGGRESGASIGGNGRMVRLVSGKSSLSGRRLYRTCGA